MAIRHLTKVQLMQERSTDRRTHIAAGEDARVLSHRSLYQVSSRSDVLMLHRVAPYSCSIGLRLADRLETITT